MTKCEKLLEKVKASKTSVRFTDLGKLVVCWGYQLQPNRTGGTHIQIYKHKDLRLPINEAMLNLQPDKKKRNIAKPYQVRQVLSAIEIIKSQFPDYKP